MPGGGKTAGIGAIVIVLIGAYFGIDVSQFLNGTQGLTSGGTQSSTVTQGEGIDDEMRHFVEVVLGSTEEVWTEQFRKMGKTYKMPTLKLFTGSTNSACGFASAAIGPFYCPADETVYLDVGFFDDLKNRFGAPGDFAQAYVIAHEVGHHVQYLLGDMQRVHSQKGHVSEKEFNDLSVRLELQADFYAGFWAHHGERARAFLEEGDLDEALGAASAIGDDRIQMQTRGYVAPDSFTHGSSQQRVKWFRKGFQSGQFSEGDTFSVRNP